MAIRALFELHGFLHAADRSRDCSSFACLLYEVTATFLVKRVHSYLSATRRHNLDPFQPFQAPPYQRGNEQKTGEYKDFSLPGGFYKMMHSLIFSSHVIA